MFNPSGHIEVTKLHHVEPCEEQITQYLWKRHMACENVTSDILAKYIK
jgi:hypothetical protein